jgi:hypothetical protein
MLWKHAVFPLASHGTEARIRIAGEGSCRIFLLKARGGAATYIKVLIATPLPAASPRVVPPRRRALLQAHSWGLLQLLSLLSGLSRTFVVPQSVTCSLSRQEHDKNVRFYSKLTPRSMSIHSLSAVGLGVVPTMVSSRPPGLVALCKLSPWPRLLLDYITHQSEFLMSQTAV